MLKQFLWQTLPFYAGENDGGAAADPPADNGGAATDPAAGDGGAAAAADPAAGDGGAAAPAGAGPDWRDKEIRRKHAQLQEERRQRAELEGSLAAANAMLQRLSGDQPAGDGGAAAPDPAAAPAARPAPRQAPPVTDPDAVRAEAAKIVAQQNFERSSNDTDAAGRERYGAEWQKATDTLATLGGFDIDTMNNILAADDPAQVLHKLGTNPEEYQRIMDLPAAKRFAEIVKMGIPTKKSSPKPSDAPAPTEGVRGANRGDPTALNDELDDDTWYARRAAQKKARFEARQAGRAG